MKRSNILKMIIIVIIFLCTNCAFAIPKVTITYEKATNAQEQEILQLIQNSGVVESVVTFINEEFLLDRSINLIIGRGEFPFADFDHKEIFIPFSFVESVFDTFAESQQGANTHQAAMNVLTHIILHEFGHMLVLMYDIPVVGREEDAVDAFATVSLIHFNEEGIDIVKHVAEYYGLDKENIKILRKWDFMDEHSLSLQRHYQISCHLYGSDPQKFKSLPRKIGFSKRRSELCIEEYRRVSASWLNLLKPYLHNSM